LQQKYAEMKKLLIFVCCLTALSSCHKDDDEPETRVADRTVLIYMGAENDLSGIQGNTSYANDDLAQMREGSKSIPANNHLLVYLDAASKKDKPYLMELVNGETVDSVAMDEDLRTSDPETLLTAMRQVMSRCPANEYALVLWGHASGWLIENDSVASSVWSTPLNVPAPRKAYGLDTGNNTAGRTGTWMNIPSMARALSLLPKLKFIFADCCNFQCAEVGYELRNVTDYIIGSPAEIPGEGAPYHTIVPALFDKETFWQAIVDRYYAQVIHSTADLYVPLSVIKTSEMENLAQATRTVLGTFVPNLESAYPDMTDLIHYYYHGAEHKFYDMNDFILRYASESDYATWKQAFDRAVIYKKMSSRWMTNVTWFYYYNDFTVTEEKYGGISMFVPQWYYQNSINDKIKKLGWYYASGYADVNW
jgi:hypothetical protein